VGPEELAPLAAAADIVLDCSDNFATRHAINRACVAAKKPLVSGAALRFDGQIAVFDARDGTHPCYHCLFGEGSDFEETRCAAVGIACWLGAAAAAQTAPTAAEWQAIQQVIAAQRTAIIAGEAEKAFSYASPGIQQQFGDAASFLAMVDAAYAALESARYVEF